MSNLQISLTSIRDSFLDPEILEIYYDIEHKQTWKNNWSKLHENKIWKELCFCLLSGNVAYELVQSVITVLERKKYLDYSWILEEKQSKKILYDLFSNPNFEPKKKMVLSENIDIQKNVLEKLLELQKFCIRILLSRAF